jgi:hypothetical protein
MSFITSKLGSSYTWFFYLGIILFITHLALYGFGLNLSFFGLILIYIGIRKPALSNWFRNILWILIAFDVYNNVSEIYKKFSKLHMVDMSLKEGAATNANDDDDIDESDDNDDIDESEE